MVNKPRAGEPITVVTTGQKMQVIAPQRTFHLRQAPHFTMHPKQIVHVFPEGQLVILKVGGRVARMHCDAHELAWISRGRQPFIQFKRKV